MDKLLMYLGEDFTINEKIIVHQPSILDIAQYGEHRYFNIVHTICSIPSDYKSELWDLGYDYCKVNDFECFVLLTRNIGADDTKLLLGDVISFKDMIPAVSPETQQLVLIDKDNDIIIDELIYTQMIEYIRELHNIHPKRERAANKETREILISEDRAKKSLRNSESDEGSILLPLISSMVNSPGFKYDIEQLKNLGIYSFMDSVQRIQTITIANSIYNGMYSGMIDLSKNPSLNKQINWLRDLSSDKRISTNVVISESKS